MTKPNWPVAVPPGQENVVLTRVARDSHSMLTNGLTIADNMNATIVKLQCIHAREILIAPGTTRGRPLFFQPMFAHVDEQRIVPALPVKAVNPLNLTRSDGRIGLTVYFDPPPNMIGVTKNANQTGTAGGANQITWQTTEYVRGTFSYTGAGLFTIPVSGIIRASCDINLVGNGIAGEAYGLYVAQTVTGKRYAQCRVGVGTGTTIRLNTSDEFPVIAGETFAWNSFNSGTNRDIEWSATTQNTRAAFSYVAPPIDYTAWVTGILWAG